MENLVTTMHDNSSFRDKNVLVTGHTGFKGGWLSIWLDLLGARVTGIALDPQHPNDVFPLSRISRRIRDHRTDIRDAGRILEIFDSTQPEIVFHLAAQPLVLESYRDPLGTFAVNTQGTVHLLEAIRQTPSVRAAVLITTDKCYENREWMHGYRETDPMGGHDPYSASKGAAEIAIASYRRSFFAGGRPAAIASARAGNVIGGGDWSDYRLVPDIIRAIESGRILEIRNPAAIRPWQHVLEPLGGYLLLAQKLLEAPAAFSEAWNFGPLPQGVHPVGRLVEAFFQYYREHSSLQNAGWRDVSDPSQPHEAGLLMLDINKAIHQLGWKPVLDFRETIGLTADWYSRCAKTDVLALCQEQIYQYQELWKLRNGN